ncbi:MAG: GNAT family N-acetyltransferase [Pseudomonadota bacterium]
MSMLPPSHLRRTHTPLARIMGWARLASLLARVSCRRLVGVEDLQASFALRGRVFGEHLGWVSCDADGLDRDEYDQGAVHLGVWAGGRLLGSVRLIQGPGPYMLDREFAPLIEGTRVGHGPDSLELTRLAVDPSLWGTPSGALVRALLYRALIRWALAHGVRQLYAVVTGAYAASLYRRYGFEPIGIPWQFGDGPLCTAVVCDLRGALRRLPVDAPLEAAWLFGVKAIWSARAALGRVPRGAQTRPA